MNTLHLISDNRMKHTVHIDCSNTGACDAAIEHLQSEAFGIYNTIIICDKNNMPLTYINFTGSHRSRVMVSDLPSQSNIMLMTAILILVAYMVFI